VNTARIARDSQEPNLGGRSICRAGQSSAATEVSTGQRPDAAGDASTCASRHAFWSNVCGTGNGAGVNGGSGF